MRKTLLRALPRVRYPKRAYCTLEQQTLLRSGVAEMRHHGVPDAEESGKWMLKAAMSKDGDIRASFEAMVRRRLRREPVQYVIGDWDFYGLTLRCRSPVLIPRPETETLVEAIIEHHRHHQVRAFMDIGCGTGAIGLALLKEWPQSHCVFVDVSRDAIELTAENAALHGLEGRVSIELLDITQETPRGVVPDQQLDMIVSNPPYVPSAEMAELEPELAFEDPQALDGGTDGLELAKHVVARSAGLLKPDGKLWLELDEGHPRRLAEWLNGAGASKAMMEVQHGFADLAGRERFALLGHATCGGGTGVQP